MTTIEEQLRREIATVTGRVIVTDSDLMKARDALEGLIDTGQRRTRFRVLAIAAAVAVVIPVVGFAAIRVIGAVNDVSPAGPVPTSSSLDDEFLKGSAPTPQQLNGAWRVDNGTILVRFAPPNRISFDNTGRLFSNPAITGTYEVAGDALTVTVDGGRIDCADSTFGMRASVARPDRVRVVHTQPAISNCITSTGRWVLEQLPMDFDLSSSTTRADWAAGVEAADLLGDWTGEDGSYLLEFAAGSSYVVVDDSGELVDQGQWSKRGSELTLTSSAAGDCVEGDQFVLGDIEHVISHASGIRGTARQNDCGGAWASKVWWMLPDSTN